MRKALLLLCMAFVMKASFSQTIQLTNGGATDVSAATGAVPISQYFESMRFQVVYTAAELNAAGITGPKALTQLGWYVSTAPANGLPNYKIRMANTTATNSATNNTATLTEVYSVASYAPAAGGFDMLTLNGSFTWNGTDNLLVDVCYNGATYASPYGVVRLYAASTTNGSRRVRCDGCGVQCATATNTVNSFKPQVSLTFAAPPSCTAPAGLSVTAITNTSATLNWGTVAGATGGYEWAVTTSATPPVSGTATASTTAPSGTLTQNTLYYLHVRANCGAGGFSTWSTISFTTLCDPQNIPYTENFDGVTTPALPNCTSILNANADNRAWQTYTSAVGLPPASAPNHLGILYNTNATTAMNDWFFTKGLNLTGGTTYRLRFKYTNDGGGTYAEKLEVKYGNAATVAGMTTSIVDLTILSTATYAQGQYDFTPGSTGVYYIGFWGHSDADKDFLGIDDIEVILPPACADPSALTNSNITHNSADHSWTAPASPPSNGYYWIVTTSATPPANGSGTNTSGTTASSSGLLTNTQYYLHVQSSCGAGVYSPWATQPFMTTPDCSGATVITGCRASQNASIAIGGGSFGTSACGFSTPGGEILYSFTPAATGTYTLNVTASNGEYIDYMYKAASGGCGAGGWTCIDDIASVTTVGFGPLTAGTTYYLLLDAEDATVASTATFQLDCPVAAPPNDLVCNAIPLTLGGAQDCQNTAGATSAGDPTLFCSTPNNTVWYTYTPASNGTVSIVAQTPVSGNALNGWVQFYTATGTCPSLTLTQVNTGACVGEFGQNLNDSDTLSSPALTAGVTYYIMIDGFSGDVGEFCIKLQAPPPPPPCTTNLLPADGATGVAIPAGTANISWNAAAGATSYDVYFGTVNPPTALIGNTPGTNVNITGLLYNTTYYWYVAPRNTGGAATGCATSTTSFTTENPVNCPPLYATGCSLADSISYFSLKGAAGTAIYNHSGATCNTTPIAYSNYTGTISPVTLVRGESFSGFIRTGDANDYISMWIDANDNGYFEDSERVLNNLKAATTDKLYGLYIPTTTALGTHRLRVRSVYYSTKPAAPTHPCNLYTYGETEDYLVDITNVGTSRTVAAGTPGACQTAATLTIDAASNNNGSFPVFVTDSLNNYVCAIYPSGNNLGTVVTSFYVHNGPVRQAPSPQSFYYMDRNLTVAVDTQPATPYTLRYYYLTSELNALIAQPGSGVTSQSQIALTKTSGNDCVTAYVHQSPTLTTGAPGSIGSELFHDFSSLSGFSRFFLHAAIVLPVKLTDFRGEVAGAANNLYWNTTQEQNNRRFIVERSADGSNFTAIGEVATRAINGNSSSNLAYQFVDANPLEGKAYYRLQMEDNNGRKAASPIVTLRRGGGKLEIVDVRPNPTTSRVYFNVLGSSSTSMTAVVRNVQGKEVMRSQLVQSANYSVDLAPLSAGLYMIEVSDARTGEKSVFKVVKD